MRTKIEQKTLKNGIRVVTSSSKQTAFASFSIGFAAGSRFANPKHSGLAHFVEHCAFHSTTKHSKKELSLIEKDIAASSGASTTSFEMRFGGNCFAKDLYLMLDIAFERIFDSKYDETEIENEKGIVHQEISRSLLNKEEQLQNKLCKVLFPKLYEGGFKILGSHEELDAIKPEDVKDFIAQYFVPTRMVVSASGNINNKRLCKYLLKKFPNKAKEEPFLVNFKGETSFCKNECIEVNLFENNSVGIHLFLTDERKTGTREHVALSMLSTLLTGMGVESIMYDRIREQKQLVYFIRAGLFNYENTEYFSINFETTKLQEAFKEICACLIDVATSGVDERFLEQCKQLKKKDIEKRNEDIYGRPPRIAVSRTLRGKDCSEEYYKKVDSLELTTTNEDIKEAAKTILNSSRVVVATDSKLFGEKEAREFIKMFNKAKKEI